MGEGGIRVRIDGAWAIICTKILTWDGKGMAPKGTWEESQTTTGTDGPTPSPLLTALTNDFETTLEPTFTSVSHERHEHPGRELPCRIAFFFGISYTSTSLFSLRTGEPTCMSYSRGHERAGRWMWHACEARDSTGGCAYTRPAWHMGEKLWEWDFNSRYSDY